MRALLLTLVVVAAAPAAQTYLVAAGVETYDDGGISPLKYACADARAVAETFQAAGVPARNVTLLTSDAPDRLKLPTRFNILQAIGYVRELAVEGDTVIFLFSGHGAESGGESYLLAMDTDRETLARSALSMSDVNEKLRGLQASHLLFIIDACRNDPNAGRATADDALSNELAKGLRPRLLANAQGKVPDAALLLACDVGQRAWELPAEGHGAFTWYLLQALRGEARDDDGLIRLGRLARYLAEQVLAWAQRAGREQTPRLENPTGADFVLLLVAPAQPRPDTPTGPTAPAVELLRREGVLELTTTLPAVRVELNGEPAGEVAAGRPIRVSRLVGKVTVRGAAAGRAPVEVEAEVKLNQTTSVALELLQLPSLRILPDLPSTVEVDGVVRGEASPAAPLTVDNLSVGPHTVKVTAPGRAPAEQRMTLAAGRTETLALSPLVFATVTFEVEEDGVAVALDDQPVGTLGPGNVAVVRNVAPGQHTVVATRGDERQEQTVTLEPGKEQTVTAWSAARLPDYFQHPKRIPGLQYRTSPKDLMPQVLIPAGEFLVGSPDGEGESDEHPQKRVYVSAFWMDLHEVTVAQYQRFCQATGRAMDNREELHPVVNVSWDDAAAYAQWAGRQLPTEAQWEKAARGGLEGMAYPWGNEWNKALANNGGGTKPVGSYQPNGYGLYDMAGNVWEWCRDWYDDGWYAHMPARDPCNETNATFRVLRGGSWDGSPRYLRVATRTRGGPDCRDGYIGFRCAGASP